MSNADEILTPAQKAAATRRRNSAAQKEKWREELAAIRSAKVALRRVMDDTTATPEQILEAARLLVEFEKR